MQGWVQYKRELESYLDDSARHALTQQDHGNVDTACLHSVWESTSESSEDIIATEDERGAKRRARTKEPSSITYMWICVVTKKVCVTKLMTSWTNSVTEKARREAPRTNKGVLLKINSVTENHMALSSA